jgi:hypothetical protein
MKIDRGGWAGGRFAITIVGDLLLEYERYVSLEQVHSRGRHRNDTNRKNEPKLKELLFHNKDMRNQRVLRNSAVVKKRD